MNAASTSHRTRGLAALVALLAFGGGLAACGSSPSATSTTTTTTTGATGSSGATGSTASNLSSLTSLAAAGKNATFKAVYTYTSAGKTQTITFAQSPPKSLFKVGTSGDIINDGTTSYYCGAGVCYASKSSSNPLVSLTGLFDGQEFLDNVQNYPATEAALAAHGLTLTYSNSSYAGQPSKCVTVHSTKGSTKTFTWCVATNGIMTSWAAGSASFSLTSFTTSPPASDFQVPAGYRVVNAP
jgi:hypothetical protein